MPDYEQPVNDLQEAPEYEGEECPVCGGEFEREREIETFTTFCQCLSCGATWTEFFVLGGYDNLADKDGNPVEPEN